MSTLTPEALRKDGLVVYPVADGEPVLPPDLLSPELTLWEFATEAECEAAIRILNWVQANGDQFGCCTMPYRVADARHDCWHVWLGLGEDFERPDEDEEPEDDEEPDDLDDEPVAITDEVRRVVQEGMGYAVDDDRIRAALDEYRGLPTPKLQRRLRQLSEQLDLQGGRGVELADELDALRIVLSLREERLDT